MKVLIVDDVALARDHLRRCLDGRVGISVIGEATDGVEAAVLCETLKPDALFLDVDMPRADGFTVASEAARCPIVFVSAHAHYAVPAFDIDAVDFVLKPYTRDRIDRALERLQSRTSQRGEALLVAERGGSRLVPVSSVTRFYAVDKYVGFVLAGRELLVRDSLDELERRFTARGFVRLHRGELVRLSAITQITEDIVVLSDGQSARVSRRRSREVREAVQRHVAVGVQALGR